MTSGADAVFRVARNLVGNIGAPNSSVLELPDGSLLGTSNPGGDQVKGLVYRLSQDGVLTVLHSFTGWPNDGESPSGPLVRTPAGYVYGTTYFGGPSNGGTVYRISPDGAYESVAFLPGRDGTGPARGLALGDDGNLYGTTMGGGSANAGTLFRISPSGSYALLYSFEVDRRYPNGTLIKDGSGLLYGTTLYGGASGKGILFQFNPVTGAVSTLHSFDSAEGAYPYEGLAAGPDGALYGVTSGGGAYDKGTIYRYSPGTGVQLVYSFPSRTALDSYSALVCDGDSNLYGTWWDGGSEGAGAVFRVSRTGGFSILHSFTGADGAFPGTPLAWARDGSLLGSTWGRTGPGSVFRLTTAGPFTTIRLFDDPDGSVPSSDLTLGPSGDLYWTTYGEVVRASTDGTIRFVRPFWNSHGTSPQGGVTVGTDGALWGVNRDLGPLDGGTVFRLTEANELSIPCSFSPDSGYHPNAPLLLSASGRLYGTTNSAPASWTGSIFRIAADGQVETMHFFSWEDLDDSPEGRLLEDPQGNLYGVLSYGGYAAGKVYRLRADGSFETLHWFSGSDGARPYAGLTWGADGALYGTTFEGGSSFVGTVFRLPMGGPLQVLHQFSGPDGAGPMSALTLAPDGYLYGTTRRGGSADAGTIFRISPSGRFAALHAFSGVDGSMPVSSLLPTGNNVYLGLTAKGGSQLGGVLYELRVPTPPPSPSSIAPFSGPASGGTRVTILGAGFQAGAQVWFGGVPASGVEVVSPTLLVATTPLHSPGSFDVAVRNSDEQADLLEQAFTFVPALSPVVESVAPPFGPSAGGTRVELLGSRFRIDTAVSFGTAPSTHVEWISDTRMVAEAPTHPAGLVDVVVTNPDSLPASLTGSYYFTPEPAPGGWFPLVPCRLVDTRGASGPGGGPGLAPNERRRILLAPSANCGVPATAKALTTNVTAVGPESSGELRVYPGDALWTGTTTVPFQHGSIRANNANLKLADDDSGSVWIWNASTGTVHVVIDVSGYFQ